MKINAVLFTGLGHDTWSDGLLDLEEKLLRMRGEGVDYVMLRHYSQYQDIAKRLQRWRDPTVLIGHSFGVRAAMRAAREAGVSIPLVISCDPSQYSSSIGSAWYNNAPENVVRVTNYYQPREWYLFFSSIGGVRVKRDDGTERNIKNYLMERESHTSIDNSELFHEFAIEDVRSVLKQ